MREQTGEDLERQLVVETAEALHELVRGWYGQDFAFDVETTGLDYARDRLLGLALTFPAAGSFYVVLAHTVPHEERHAIRAAAVAGAGNGDVAPVVEDGTPEIAVTHPLREFVAQDDLVAILRGLFAQRDAVMVAHNAKFDLHFLSRAGLAVEGRLFDTLLAAQLLDENRSVGLKSLAPRELGMDLPHYQDLVAYPGFPKDSILAVPLADAAAYAMRDTLATWRLYERFAPKLVEEGVEDAFRTIWMPLCVTLQQMEARGIALDLDLVRAVKADYEAKAAEHDLAVWREGVAMLLARYRPEDIPKGYLRMATEEEIAAAAENDGFATVNGVALPVLQPTPRSLPRVPDFKTGSTKHLGELLYDHLKLEPPPQLRLKKNADGSPSANRDTLEAMRFFLGDQAPAALKHVLDYRKASKFVSTYCERFLADADPADHDAIRTSFNQAAGDNDRGGTVTGRLSSSDPNLQNIPSRGEEGKKARQMFVARPGHDLIVADLGQAELRMLAHFSQDPVLTQAFVEGRDLHLQTGAGFAGTTYDDLKARYEAGEDDAKRLRMLGKTGNFALVYGMGARKFQVYLLVNNGVNVPVEEAQRLIDLFNDTYKVATAWKLRVMRYARRHGHVLTLAGRKRRLPDVWSDDKWTAMRAERQSVNAVIQGSVGDVIGEAMPRIQRVFAPLGASLLLQVHDELVAEAPEAVSSLCAEVMADLMVRFVNPRLRCPQIADAHVAKSWGAAKG